MTATLGHLKSYLWERKIDLPKSEEYHEAFFLGRSKTSSPHSFFGVDCIHRDIISFI